MSSISSSDRSRKTDELRRTREEYESREAEGTKKQKKEIRRLQEKHNEEVKQLEQAYQQRMNGLREKSRDSLTKKDQSHLEQVDQIRELYHEQLRRKSEDSDTNQNVLRKTLTSEMEKRESIADQQRSELERNFRDSLKERDSQFINHAEKSREEVQSSLNERTEKLNKKHDRELESVVQARDRKVIELQNNMGEQKSHLTGKLKELERRSASEKERLDDNWRSIVSNQESVNSTVLENRNTLLKAERDSMRDDYRLKIDNEVGKYEKLRENLQEEVGERLDRQVRRAKYDLRKSESERIQGDLVNHRIRKTEKDNIVQSYEDRMRDLERQKDGIHDVAQEVSQKRVNEIVTKSDRLLQTSNRRKKMEQEMINQRNREDRERLIADGQVRIQRAEDRSALQVDRVKKVTQDSQQVQSKYYERNLEQLKDNYAEQLGAQREAQLSTLAKIRLSMEEKIRQQDMKAQNKLEGVVSNFESKIKAMEESHRDEVKRLRTAMESRVEQRDKASQMEREQLTQKYEVRMAQQQDVSQQEIDRVQKRHEQSLADMSQRMSYLRKKV